MTTQAQAREAIYKRFIDAWAAIPRTEPVTLDNESFRQPSPSSSWIRVSIRHRGAEQETMGPVGSRKFARTGVVFVQVFTPADTGTALSDLLIGLSRDIFEGVSIVGTTIRFNGVSTREVGPDGKWYSALVEAPFEYDETK